MMSEDPTYPEFTDDDERRNALQQMRIYEAIIVAANDAHGVLDIVLNASDPDAACRALEDRYGFTETQAQAVMDLQFRRLTSADRHTFEQHRQELSARVAVLNESLGEADLPAGQRPSSRQIRLPVRSVAREPDTKCYSCAHDSGEAKARQGVERSQHEFRIRAA